VAELLGSAIGGLFNKAKRLHACKVHHAMPPPSRCSHAKTRDITTNKKKKKKLLDAFHTFHARRQPSLDS